MIGGNRGLRSRNDRRKQGLKSSDPLASRGGWAHKKDSGNLESIKFLSYQTGTVLLTGGTVPLSTFSLRYVSVKPPSERPTVRGPCLSGASAGLFFGQLCEPGIPLMLFPRRRNIIMAGREDRSMSKGEMAVIVIISWFAGLVILAVLFTAAGIEPSDFPGWLLLIVWLSISKIIHAVITGLKR